MKYTVIAKVMKVEEKFATTYTDNEREIKQTLGWFVHFEGSHEMIYLGNERPEFEIGDTVTITFEKQNS